MVLFTISALLIPSITEGKTYYYSGKAYVDSKYRYVGFTPEKIIIKTNVRFDKSLFGSSHSLFPVGQSWFSLPSGKVFFKTLNIKLYSWATYPYKHWFLQDEKTYHNTFNSLGGVEEQEFSVKVAGYYKHWWDRFFGRLYLKFIITIPKDKELIHHNSGKTKIVVTVTGDGSAYIGGGLQLIDFKLVGRGTYWTRPTPMNKYRQYWGSSASVNIANLDEAPSPNAYILSIDNETGTATFTMQPLTVEENNDTVNERVLLLGGALIVACVAVLIVMNKKK